MNSKELSATNEFLKAIQFTEEIRPSSTKGFNKALGRLEKTLDILSADIYDILKQHRNQFSAKERFEAGEYANQLLEIKELVEAFRTQISPSVKSEKCTSNIDKLSTAKANIPAKDDEFDLDIELDFDESDFFTIEGLDFEELDVEDMTNKNSENPFNLEVNNESDKNRLNKEKIQNTRSCKTSILWECNLHENPKGFEIDGVYQDVTSWSDLFEKICTLFYSKDSKKMLSFVGKPFFGNGSVNHNYFALIRAEKRSYFTLESEEYGKLYVECEENAMKVRHILIKLLGEYGFAHKDLLIYS